MSLNGDPSKASVALAIKLGIAKEGEPLTPLMSMLTTLKDYAEHVDIGAYKGTQASWASCIPHAENLLQLEREVLGKLREKIAEWDSKLLSRTGELAELNERLERMTQETARANEELTQATQKQSDANKQLSMTLQVTRTAQENHAKDEQRLKQKEDLLTIRSDDLEKQKALAATKEACLKRRLEEIEVRESKMAATQRLAMDSDTQAKRHLDAIRKAHSTLWMLTDKIGNPTAGLSAEELVVDLQSLTSNIQDQITQINDSRTKAVAQEAKAREINNRELKALRNDVVAKASMIQKAELCAADYKNKYDSLQATSSERIHELELSQATSSERIHELEQSNQNLSIAAEGLKGRLSEALQNHTKMVTEYSKYKALERTEKTLNKHIQDMEGHLQAVERQRDNANAANRAFKTENTRLQTFEQALRVNEEKIRQYILDRDREVSQVRAEAEASETEAQRLKEQCENLRSQVVTNTQNAATDIERVQGASNTKIVGLEKLIEQQDEQLNDFAKLVKEREDKLREADDLNTSLYQKLKDAASARDAAARCHIEHQNFEELKRQSSELQIEVNILSRTRKAERQENNQITQALRSQLTASKTEVNRLDRVISENRETNSQSIKALEHRIAQLENEIEVLESQNAEDHEALMGENADLQLDVKHLNHTISQDRQANSHTFKALEGQTTQLGDQLKALESEKAKDQETYTRTIKALEGQTTQLGDQIRALESKKAKDQETYTRTIKALEGQIAQLGDQVKALESKKAKDQETYTQTIKALEGQTTQLGDQIKALESEKAKDHGTSTQTIKALEGQNTQLGEQIKALESEKAKDHGTSTQTIKALEGQNTQLGEQVRALESEKATNYKTSTQATKALEGRITQLGVQVNELESGKLRDQALIKQLRGLITDYTKSHSETAKGLEEQFTQFKAKIMGLESEKAEATERATTTDHTLRTYHETITRLRGERDQARQEITVANDAYETALEDARQARQELELLQQSVTPDSSNIQRASSQPRKKRRTEELHEEDRSTVDPGDHEYDLQEIRDPEFTDPNIPAEVLDKLHGQFERWDQKSGQEWARQTTKNRCVETRLSRVSAQREHGNGHACEYCCDRGRICVVVRRAGIVTLLPVYQDGEAVGPEEEGYWTK